MQVDADINSSLKTCGTHALDTFSNEGSSSQPLMPLT